jgi:hypothetical protein
MKLRPQPTSLLERFEAAKLLSAEEGFKIFTPSPLYFRAEHQFIGASNDTKAKGVFRVWIYKNVLYIEFLPFYENRAHKKYLDEMLGRELKERRHHPAMGRFYPAHKMVKASDHREFDLLVPNIRLP